MATQDTYSDNLAVGKKGAISNMVPATTISRNVEEAAGIAFGLAVSQGSADDGIVDYTGDFVGITVRDRSVNADQDGYVENESARLITQGCVTVEPIGVVAAGQDVHIVGGGNFGAAAGDVIPGARWETSAAAGNPAVIRLG